MDWEIVIGIETHAQLATRSKIFSGASTAFGASANAQASAVDIALPGVLPVLNQAALDCALRFGLAVGGEAVINRRSIFARKNYFYPDLPKGYQISQYELPIVKGGAIALRSPTRGEIRVALTRAHLEEDAGKSLHEFAGSDAADWQGLSGIDLNRAGTPLLEIVSEPEMRGAAEAVAYARALHALVVWIGICDGNMQEGSFRCDANVSVRRIGDTTLGTRCEIKNLNSFRFMERAIEYEARRQIDVLEDGGRVIQQTRLYDSVRDETRAMRSKEDAHDYRYFPDPDLMPILVRDEDLRRAAEALPELPDARRERLVRQFDLSAADAVFLTSSRAAADYFEALVAASGAPAKLCANWQCGELAAALNRAGLAIESSPVSAAMLAGLVFRIADGTLSGKMAKDVFDALWAGEGPTDRIIEARGLRQIRDSGEIEKIVADAVAANPKLVEDYRSGKDKAFNALVGQVMKASRGKADPARVNELLRAMLAR